MTWHDKLERWLDESGQSFADAERQTGITANTLSEKVRKRRDLGVIAGLDLATYMQVDPHWLFDDDAVWPPVKAVAPSPTSPQFRDAVLDVVMDAMSAAKSAMRSLGRADNLGSTRPDAVAKDADVHSQRIAPTRPTSTPSSAH